MPGPAAHIACMAIPFTSAPALCTPYPAATAAAPDEPELGYRYFTPEFLDELDEYYRSVAVAAVRA